ncbi:hypothetical protein EVAR_56942_1 [Eumeta japonica]|uniref:Uncharacterized protein n=1 Tax=Eumeta variegata TaxID=151549 RepID=A0A4C1YLZ2_EUMVA|nr:hypothetical protein EVAR_56942_1 [Eumeta japonica]
MLDTNSTHNPFLLKRVGSSDSGFLPRSWFTVAVLSHFANDSSKDALRPPGLACASLALPVPLPLPLIAVAKPVGFSYCHSRLHGHTLIVSFLVGRSLGASLLPHSIGNDIHSVLALSGIAVSYLINAIHFNRSEIDQLSKHYKIMRSLLIE